MTTNRTLRVGFAWFLGLAGTAAVALSTVGVVAAEEPPQPRPRVIEPPRPERLDVSIRYRIRADRDERIRQFRVLEQHLASLGFEDDRKDDPDRELDILDPTAERFSGRIPSSRVLEILDDPRVQNILFAPTGYAYPERGDAPLPVRVTLRDGLSPREQQRLHLQVLERLERLGFRDALGYDTRGYTQLKGTIPYKHLPRLLRDLREEPAGWFVPDTPLELVPRPLADRNPIRWVEVMPPRDPVPPWVPEAVPEGRLKLSPDLRAVLADPARKEMPLRVTVRFTDPVEDHTESLRTRLAIHFPPSLKRDAEGNPIRGPDGQPAVTEGASLEGAFGNVAAIRFDRPADVERFAAEADVLSVCLPRDASETVMPLTARSDRGTVTELHDVLRATGLERLHRLGYRGAGVKVVVVASDFTGADELIGKVLPKTTRIVDLTAELDPEIRPAAADPLRGGTGTAVARSLALAAPEAELVLVRIDPGAVFQLFGMLKLIRGEDTATEAMRSRLADIARRTTELNLRKAEAVTEYRSAFEDLADDEPSKARRDRAKKQLDAVIAEQAELARRVERFNTFQRQAVEALLGARVVVNTLVWESGYPLDALSRLSRTLERLAARAPVRVVRPVVGPSSAPPAPLVWVQAASASGAAVWGGPFLDANRDGVMEFAPPDAALPATNWSHELNFLGSRAADGETAAELPAGTKLRLTMQWREPLDPNLPSVERPNFPVVLRVFKQLDPRGEKIPSDEMAEVARSAGGPYPLLLTDTFVVYEQILEFTVPDTGRYALAAAQAYEPQALLPALRRQVEVHPRIVIDTLTTRPNEPRVVFRSYAVPGAGVGMPGDSAGVITVGSGGVGELSGGGTGLSLRRKPDFYGPFTLAIGKPAFSGPGIATGYLGGMAATLVQTGAAGPDVFRSVGLTPGREAVLPEAWLRFLRPAAK